VMHLPVGKLVNIQSRSELQVVTDILHLQNQKIVTYKGDYDTFERTRDERIRNQMKAHEANERTRGHIQVRFNTSNVCYEANACNHFSLNASNNLKLRLF
jgi:ATPase subunit of ABC transporter with duplicated ATPase domains